MFAFLVVKYRHLELLLNSLNHAFSRLMIPAIQYICGSVVIVSLVSCFRIEGLLRYAMGAMALVMYIMLLISFNTMAEFHVRSQALLQKRKQILGQSSPEVRRIYETLRELKIEIGSFGFVDKTLILTLTGIILNYSITFFIITSSY